MVITDVEEEEYETVWRPIHARIFVEEASPARPFNQDDWLMVLLSGDLTMDSSDFVHLRQVAEERGDNQFIVVDPLENFPDEANKLLPWDRGLLEDVNVKTVFGHVDTHSFGRSGEWGRLASPENFGVLGGERTFIERFIKLSGGTAVLYDRFMQSVSGGEISFGEYRDPLVRRLLALVGWSKRTAEHSE